jgi:uncharacterized protein with LGFP repeats
MVLVSELTSAEPATAANLSEFQAGNIISDEVFFNKAAMGEAEIQTFLNARVAKCATGYTCLKDFSQTTYTRPADAMCDQYTGASNEKAARIVYKVAQACGINPQAILVMLQKEQGLVASNAPSSWAWQASMGYACPDTAPCETKYFGFYNQVYMGVWQLKRYGNPPGTSNYFTWFPVGGYADVRFHPNASCGTSRVLIANKATAALYYYTPYQPNSASLAAGYGASSNACSSYGNRNFFNYFTDWFGSTGSVGPAMIDAAYAAAGGSSALGGAVSGYNTVTADGVGVVRAYERGAIAWTRAYGAHVISGAIREKFNLEGGIAGDLGWPVTSAFANARNGQGTSQAFMGGAISSSSSGTFLLTGGIRSAYNASLGGVDGALGWPTSDPTCDSKNTCKQNFQIASLSVDSRGQYSLSSQPVDDAVNRLKGSMGKKVGSIVLVTGKNGIVQALELGAITSSPSAGTHTISGAIRTQFNNAGGVAGYLGWPTSDQTCGTDGSCSQTFEGGTVYAASDSTTFAITGPILDLYKTLGGAGGKFGQPTGNSSYVASNGGGYVQGFMNGAITWTQNTGAFALSGDIRSAFNDRGGLSGRLGWPVSSQNSFSVNGGGAVQAFQGGALTWTTATGVIELSGAIRDAYNARGGITGDLGWPTTPTNGIGANGGGIVQGFQFGAIAKSPSGTFAVQGDIRKVFNTAGGLGGSLGWPITSELTSDVGTGGTLQAFQGGAITKSAAHGAVLIEGPIRAEYNRLGGLGGALGWPTAAKQCDASNLCSQTFEGGTIEWTEALGAKLR